MLDRKVKIKEVQDLGAGNYLLTLSSPEQARLVHPGQFLMLKCCEDVDENPLLRRPFSIFAVHHHPRSGSPDGIAILVKDVGAGTHKLAQVQPGQEILALGPQGRPFQLTKELARDMRYACIVAGGVGIGALYLLARELKTLGTMPVLFYGARTAAELVLREYFERLEIRTYYATEDGSSGEQGLVIAPLERFLQEHRGEGLKMYACGPWAMMRAADTVAQHFSVPCEVSLEARMGCSLGACMGCVVRSAGGSSQSHYLRVCVEGPIVNSRMIDWDHPPM
jgi:dihydroorotate dehydrogenase electron transfer subunit